MQHSLREKAIKKLESQGFNSHVAIAATDTLMDIFLAAKPAEIQKHLLIYDTLVIDISSKVVTIDGDPLALTPKEFKVLAFMAVKPNHVFSTLDILGNCWGSAHCDVHYNQYVRVVIRGLRKKIGHDRIETKSSFGYCFSV